jgi:DNA-binding CsgD family transcriptional regulator
MNNFLTPRENEILLLISEGYRSRQIADSLNLSVKTVEAHRGRVSAKLGLHGSAALTRYVLEKKRPIPHCPTCTCAVVVPIDTKE